MLVLGIDLRVVRALVTPEALSVRSRLVERASLLASTTLLAPTYTFCGENDDFHLSSHVLQCAIQRRDRCRGLTRDQGRSLRKATHGFR